MASAEWWPVKDPKPSTSPRVILYQIATTITNCGQGFAILAAGTYTVMVFNDAEASAEYVIGVEGDVFVDQLVQTNESVELSLS